MTRLSYVIVSLIIWFWLMFNLEQMITSFKIASFLYLFMTVCSVLTILVLRLHKLSLQWLFAVTLLVYAALRYQLGYSISGADLPLIVTEMSAIGVTFILSGLIGRRLNEIQEMLTSLIVGQMEQEVEPFGRGQGLLYREIRRARRYQRTLALLAISTTAASLKVSLNRLSAEVFTSRFLEDLQRETVKKYALSRIARLLIDELDDSVIVTQRDDHFVMLVPETTPDELHLIIKKISSAAKEKLDIDLKIGAATFPDQGLTFEDLLEQAETEMVKSKIISSPHLHLNGAHPGQLGVTSDDTKKILSV